MVSSLRGFELDLGFNPGAYALATPCRSSGAEAMDENPYEAPQAEADEAELEVQRRLRDEHASRNARLFVVFVASGCSALGFIGLARYLVLFMNG